VYFREGPRKGWHVGSYRPRDVDGVACETADLRALVSSDPRLAHITVDRSGESPVSELHQVMAIMVDILGNRAGLSATFEGSLLLLSDAGVLV
jgi:hypothetical protein